jgi:hypothetical protein
MSGGGPPRKRNFKIEAFKNRVELDPKYAERTWKVLEHAIHEIYNHNASGLSFEELYRLVHTPATHPDANHLTWPSPPFGLPRPVCFWSSDLCKFGQNCVCLG